MINRQREVRDENQRNELLGGFPNPDDPYSDDPDGHSQRTRLLAGTERLADGTQRLENAHRIALETEDVGADILRNLRGQREQIEHTRDTVSYYARIASAKLICSSYRPTLRSTGRPGH